MDILFNKAVLDGWEEKNYLGVPADARFNYCKDESADPMPMADYPFELALHEAGHAFGLSGFSVPGIVASPGIYKQAHPTTASAVMNYNYEVSTITDEPDCSPHPLDIMAMWVLYQTIY